MDGVCEREGFLIFDVVDHEVLVRVAAELPDATHFAAVGNSGVPSRFKSHVGVSETPFLDRPEIPDPADDTMALVGCPVSEATRSAIVRFLVDEPDWGSIQHWWLYSDTHVVASAYDWGMYPFFVDRDLEAWAVSLQASGVLGARRELPII